MPIYGRVHTCLPIIYVSLVNCSLCAHFCAAVSTRDTYTKTGAWDVRPRNTVSSGCPSRDAAPQNTSSRPSG